jgi:integrase
MCLYCCCRINEACTLNINDVYDRKEKVRPELLIRKGNTKGKLATRSIPVIEDLRGLLIAYQHSERGYLFPGGHGRNPINSDSAARRLRVQTLTVKSDYGMHPPFYMRSLPWLTWDAKIFHPKNFQHHFCRPNFSAAIESLPRSSAKQKKNLFLVGRSLWVGAITE